MQSIVLLLASARGAAAQPAGRYLLTVSAHNRNQESLTTSTGRAPALTLLTRRRRLLILQTKTTTTKAMMAKIIIARRHRRRFFICLARFRFRSERAREGASRSPLSRRSSRVAKAAAGATKAPARKREPSVMDMTSRMGLIVALWRSFAPRLSVGRAAAAASHGRPAHEPRCLAGATCDPDE
jgi:hypothetical protein